MATLILSTLNFGMIQAKAEAIAPESIVDSVFTEPISSNWYDQNNIYYVESMLYWLETDTNYSSYGPYYVCQIYDNQRLQTCYFFDDYSKLKYDSSNQMFYIQNPMNLVRLYSAYDSNTYPSANSPSQWNYDQYFYEIPQTSHYRYVTNLKQYLKTGQLRSPDMTDYEENYWKYTLNYQDFTVSIYDENRPSDVDWYPFDIFISAENFEDTRITIYNVLANQFIAEFTESNLEYDQDDRFLGFSYELKEGDVIRIFTTSTDDRVYYITNQYTQEQILINEVVDGETEYFNASGVVTSVSGLIDPPARGMITTVVEYEEYGDLESLTKRVSDFIESTSNKTFIIFKPIGDLFNQLNPTLRNGLISLFVLYMCGVVLILLRRG